MHKSIRQKQPVREASFLNVKNAGSTAGKTGYREGAMLGFGKLRNKTVPPLWRWNRKPAGQVVSLISYVLLPNSGFPALGNEEISPRPWVTRTGLLFLRRLLITFFMAKEFKYLRAQTPANGEFLPAYLGQFGGVCLEVTGIDDEGTVDA